MPVLWAPVHSLDPRHVAGNLPEVLACSVEVPLVSLEFLWEQAHQRARARPRAWVQGVMTHFAGLPGVGNILTSSAEPTVRFTVV